MDIGVPLSTSLTILHGTLREWAGHQTAYQRWVYGYWRQGASVSEAALHRRLEYHMKEHNLSGVWMDLWAAQALPTWHAAMLELAMAIPGLEPSPRGIRLVDRALLLRHLAQP